jgi:hypothetical protein
MHGNPADFRQPSRAGTNLLLFPFLFLFCDSDITFTIEMAGFHHFLCEQVDAARRIRPAHNAEYAPFGLQGVPDVKDVIADWERACHRPERQQRDSPLLAGHKGTRAEKNWNDALPDFATWDEFGVKNDDVRDTEFSQMFHPNHQLP